MAKATAVSGIVQAGDEALLYYEACGSGPAILLVHGWMMSTRFWDRQVEALSGDFTVVAMDFRAHGNSGKVLHGHTIPQYARDVRTVVERLELESVTLVGWSLGGAVVLDYWSHYGADRLSSLSLVDMTPCPFSSDAWNQHRLRGRNYDQLNATVASIYSDQYGFVRRFVDSMFHSGAAPTDDAAWMAAEAMRTPAPAAAAIYSDFVMRDYTAILPTISVPATVFASDSGVFERGIEQGEWIASRIPDGRFVASDRGGHLLFREDAATFNAAIAGATAIEGGRAG
ncbi:MAG TPA: alpha/beta hydrolase [Acidimicrobiales bacterium]|nr:alpha/beta hydrolase [Acidimicrobiales bacterium]